MYNVYIHSCVYVSDQWLIHIHCLMFTCLHTNMCTYAHIIIYSYRYIYYVLHACHPPPQLTLPRAVYGWVMTKVMSSWWLCMSGHHLLRIIRGQWSLLLVVMSFYTLCVVCIIIYMYVIVLCIYVHVLSGQNNVLVDYSKYKTKVVTHNWRY